MPNFQTYQCASYEGQSLLGVFPPRRDPPPILVSTGTRLAIHMLIRLSISLMFTTSAAALEATHVPTVRSAQRFADWPASIADDAKANAAVVRGEGAGCLRYRRDTDDKRPAAHITFFSR